MSYMHLFMTDLPAKNVECNSPLLKKVKFQLINLNIQRLSKITLLVISVKSVVKQMAGQQ